jgi:hypothetical protein
MGKEFAKARRRKITDNSPDLPKGAVKCTDPMAIGLLQAVWTHVLQFYQNTRHCIHPDNLPGFGWDEISINPVVEGYRWYRGLTIYVHGGKVLIFIGWTQPWIIGGAPDPIVYLYGEVSQKEAFFIIQLFCVYLEKEMKRLT